MRCYIRSVSRNSVVICKFVLQNYSGFVVSVERAVTNDFNNDSCCIGWPWTLLRLYCKLNGKLTIEIRNLFFLEEMFVEIRELEIIKEFHQRLLLIAVSVSNNRDSSVEVKFWLKDYFHISGGENSGFWLLIILRIERR